MNFNTMKALPVTPTNTILGIIAAGVKGVSERDAKASAIEIYTALYKALDLVWDTGDLKDGQSAIVVFDFAGAEIVLPAIWSEKDQDFEVAYADQETKDIMEGTKPLMWISLPDSI